MTTQKTTQIEVKENIDAIKKKSEAMQTMVNETKVTTESELKSVADKIKNIKQLGKFVRQEMEKFTKPAQMIINESRLKYLPYERMCKEAEFQLKVKAGIYMEKIENERIKKEDAITRRAEKGTIKEDTAVRKMEELGDEQKSVSTPTTQIQRKTVREVNIIDPVKIPNEYWIIDEVKVRKAALAGVKIPGVEIKEVSKIAIR